MHANWKKTCFFFVKKSIPRSIVYTKTLFLTENPAKCTTKNCRISDDEPLEIIMFKHVAHDLMSAPVDALLTYRFSRVPHLAVVDLQPARHHPTPVSKSSNRTTPWKETLKCATPGFAQKGLCGMGNSKTHTSKNHTS